MMRTLTYSLLTLLIIWLAPSSFGQIMQDFEPGEDTTNWGSVWDAPDGFNISSPSFLAPSLGGTQAGFGTTSAGQQAYRDFGSNTGGVSLATEYSISLYTGIAFGLDTPASGRFHIYNGDFGDNNNFGNIRVGSEGALLAWEAHDSNTGWESIGINLVVGQPYYIQFDIDPANSLYDVTVTQVLTDGTPVLSSTLSDLSVGSLNPNQFGKLGFHVEGSAGTVNFGVDNILISNSGAAIPEPQTLFAILGGVSLIALATVRRRRP